MADTATLAHITGTALTPGVSRNGRLYTPDLIAKAAARMQERLAAPAGLPVVMRSHHDAGDDSRMIVGRVTSAAVNDAGALTYEADLYATAAGRDIAALTGGKSPALRATSIYGYWIGPVKTITYEGRPVETADDLEIDKIDFTATPGVTGALIDLGEHTAAESAEVRALVTETYEATLAPFTEAAAPTDAKSMRAALAKGQAMRNPGGQPSYPIRNKGELRKAIRAVGRGGADHDAIRRHVIKRAKALGLAAMVPANWNADGSLKESDMRFGEVREYMDGPDGGSGFCLDVFNGPTCLTLRNACISPADLRVVATAAMNAAIDALQAIDPDMDGDVDLPGAPDEDTDGDTVETAPAPAAPVEAAPVPAPAPPPAPEPAGPTPAVGAPQNPAVNAAVTTPETEVAMGDTSAAETATTAPVLALSEDALTALGTVFRQALADDRKAAAETQSATPAAAPAQTTAPASETAPQAAAETPKAIDQAALKESIKAELRDELREELLKRDGAPTRKGLVGETETAPTPEELYADRASIMLGDFGTFQPAPVA